MKETIRIKSLHLTNFLGLEEFDLDFSKHVTLVTGDNGEGKSTILQSLQALIEGGKPAKLIRNGATRAEIGLELDNGMKFRKVIPREGDATLVATHPEYGRISKPQSILNQIYEQISVNPARLMYEKPEVRVDYILRALPIELDQAKLREIVPADVKIPEGHALTVLPILRRQLAERRRDLHVRYDDKDASAVQLRQSLPAGAEEPQDYQALIDEVERLIEQTNTSVATRRDEIKKAAAHKINELREAEKLFISTGEQQLQEAIDRLRSEWQDRKDHMVNGTNDEVAAELKHESDYLEELEIYRIAEIEPYQAKRTELQTLSNVEAANENTRQMIARAEADRDRLKSEWENYDQRVKALDALEASLTATLPIPGLTIEDGDLAYEGVAWSTLNTAKKIEVVIKVCKLLVGDDGFVFIDNMEHLSDTNFQRFLLDAVDSGLQMLMARVNAKPLAVRRFPEELDPEPPTEE